MVKLTGALESVRTAGQTGGSTGTVVIIALVLAVIVGGISGHVFAWDPSQKGAPSKFIAVLCGVITFVAILYFFG